MPESNFGGTIGSRVGAGTGTVTSVSVATANGFSGSVANPTTAPAITIDTTAEKLLALASGVDLNTAVASTLYTVPGGKTALITRFIIYNASTSLTTVSFSIGFNSATFNDVLADATHTELTGATLFTVLNSMAGAKRGAATNVLKLLCNVLQGGAATADVRVFGILF